MHKKLLIVQVAALGYDLLRQHHGLCWEGLEFKAADSIFPALTCPVQASFRTGNTPAAHGMVANGIFDRQLMKPLFWEQSAHLVQGPRIWRKYRQAGKTVAMLFWQQSLGEDVDFVLSPAPIHKHHGGMIQDCYAKPVSLYAALCKEIGRPFDLKHYWGPLASHKASDWIAQATVKVLSDAQLGPDLCMSYLPVLDYDLQRYGPDSARAKQAVMQVLDQLSFLKQTADRCDYDLLVFGDYAIAPCCKGALYPNRQLREAGLLATRNIRNMQYPDFYTSPAFALVDHEIAHVYVQSDLDKARATLEKMPGIDRVLQGEAIEQAGLNSSRAGELVLLANPGHWFAYPWWTERREAPEYAGHVDIHNKPGYDPCELFWGWPPGSVSQNPNRIQGSHGCTGKARQIAWCSTCIDFKQASLLDLAKAIQERLEKS
jgi:predicted AlkP superfamily pyrophosphatase or phosphodiesterase